MRPKAHGLRPLSPSQGLKYLEFHHVADDPAPPARLLEGEAKDGLVEVEDVKNLLEVVDRLGRRDWFRESIGMSGGGGR